MPLPRIHVGEPPRSGECVFSRSYPSRIERKQAVIDEIAAEFSARQWVDEADKIWLGLCLDEVVINAMLHGNEGDPDLEMTISLYQDGARWVLIVTDQGDGFTADALPDIDDSQSLLLEHGRGIRIMSEWLDDLVYYRQGAIAVLSRRIPVTGVP
mgnify:CR=1 FL=1